jgi:hypothetical protein
LKREVGSIPPENSASVSAIKIVIKVKQADTETINGANIISVNALQARPAEAPLPHRGALRDGNPWSSAHGVPGSRYSRPPSPRSVAGHVFESAGAVGRVQTTPVAMQPVLSLNS